MTTGQLGSLFAAWHLLPNACTLPSPSCYQKRKQCISVVLFIFPNCQKSFQRVRNEIQKSTFLTNSSFNLNLHLLSISPRCFNEKNKQWVYITWSHMVQVQMREQYHLRHVFLRKNAGVWQNMWPQNTPDWEEQGQKLILLLHFLIYKLLL